MEKIIKRIKELIRSEESVWMNTTSHKDGLVNVVEVEERGGKWYCKNKLGFECEMTTNESAYTWVDYNAPLFNF